MWNSRLVSFREWPENSVRHVHVLYVLPCVYKFTLSVIRFIETSNLVLDKPRFIYLDYVPGFDHMTVWKKSISRYQEAWRFFLDSLVDRQKSWFLLQNCHSKYMRPSLWKPSSSQFLWCTVFYIKSSYIIYCKEHSVKIKYWYFYYWNVS